MGRMLGFLFFWCLSLVSVLCSEFGETSINPSVSPILQLTSKRDFSVLLFPELKSVAEMTFAQVIDILEIYHNPENQHLSSKAPDILVQLIVHNFFQGHLGDIDVETINRRTSIGVRHPRYNRYVLSQMENDMRIVSHLGFEGCVKIVGQSMELIKKGLERTSTSYSTRQSLYSAVESVEEFLYFVLKRVARPYQIQRGDWRYTVQNERSHELSYYSSIVSVLSVSSIAALDAKHTIKVIVDRFRPWLPDETIFEFLHQFRLLLHNFSYFSLRLMITHLVEVGGKEAFCNLIMMPRRYSVINDSLFARITSTDPEKRKEQASATVYVQMCPVLRALMLIDSAKETSVYLTSFSTNSYPRVLAANPDGPIHRVLDHMIADTRFARRAFKNLDLAARVLNVLDLIFAWNRAQILKIAIRRNLLNLTEVLFMFSGGIDDDKAVELISDAIIHLRQTDSVELILLVAAHCCCMDATKLEALANSIETPEVLTKEFLQRSDLVYKYDLYALGKSLLIQAATVIWSFGGNSIVSRSILARSPNERIPFPCHPLIIDFLYPKLYEFDPAKRITDQMSDFEKRKLANKEYDLYPHYSLLNLAQFLLYRMFGITFSISRLQEDGRDTPEWREVIGFLNFMIGRAAKLNRVEGELVQFYDPVEEELKPLHLNAEEYAFTYRQLALNYYSEMERTRLDEGFVIVI